MKDKIRLGMLLFIASESVFFVLLIIAFVVYHTIAGNAAEAARHLDRYKTGIFTVFLVSSSLTVWRAGASQRLNRRSASLFWLAVTICFGAVFLIGQALEYRRLILQDVTISRDLFGTTFFTLTGFHGLHVFTGLVMLSIMFGIDSCRRPNEPQQRAGEAVSMYWHFVDVVWMVIFPVVYLWGVL
jgi:heme/copper-type cytochrome/quinol oxidase subunit 3